MSYRIHLLALVGVSGEAMKSKILACSPAFDLKLLDNPFIFSADENWSCLGVSTRSDISDHFETLASGSASVWITTNDVDDWSLVIRGKSDVLASLHLPLVNVDPREHCESDGQEVVEVIAGTITDELSKQLAALDTNDAWNLYFDDAQATISQSLTDAGIRFDSAKLARMFSPDAFRGVSKSVAAQLGYFVNDILGIGFDLSPADD